MNKVIINKNSNVSSRQVRDFFCRQAKIEKEKTASREKVMEQQLDKVTKGKNILVSNKSN